MESSKRRLVLSIQTFQAISDTRTLAAMKRNHLFHLTTQPEHIQVSKETMWAQDPEYSGLKKAIRTLNFSITRPTEGEAKILFHN